MIGTPPIHANRLTLATTKHCDYLSAKHGYCVKLACTGEPIPTTFAASPFFELSSSRRLQQDETLA